jgi:hypothetical protein
MSALNTKCPKVINIRKKELNKLGYNDFEDWATSDVNNLYIGRNTGPSNPTNINTTLPTRIDHIVIFPAVLNKKSIIRFRL